MGTWEHITLGSSRDIMPRGSSAGGDLSKYT